MMIVINRKRILIASLSFLVITILTSIILLHSSSLKYISLATSKEYLNERFHRPSKQLPYPNNYQYSDFVKPTDTPPLITKKFESPEDVILAFYGIIREASNMLGYSGGCGSIGDSLSPYSYAYELLSSSTRSTLSLKEFISSFEGTGFETLLKLYPAYKPPNTPVSIDYYIFEVEVITGAKIADNSASERYGSFFTYYYGIITTEKTSDGYKIKKFDYLPEDFLCAPTHSWFYLADSVVGIVYIENLKLVTKIDKTEQIGDMVYVYASSSQKYRFDFVRLTNGYDVLIHENIYENGKYVETDLLTDSWKSLKLSIENPNLDN